MRLAVRFLNLSSQECFLLGQMKMMNQEIHVLKTSAGIDARLHFTVFGACLIW